MRDYFKRHLFGLPLALVLALILALAFMQAAPASYASSTPSDWQLVLEKPESVLWQGQPADFTVIALNPPTDDLELSITGTHDFMVSQRPPVRLQRGDIPALGFPVRLTPLQAGELKLPVFSVGEQQTGASESVTISKPALTEDMSINVTYNTDNIYLGQTIDIQFEWITAIQPNALQAVNILLPEFENASITPVEPWNAFTSRDSKLYRFTGRQSSCDCSLARDARQSVSHPLSLQDSTSGSRCL